MATMAQQFSFHRVIQFIKRDLVLLRGTYVTGFLVAIILMFLFCLFNMIWDKQLSSEEFLGIFTLIAFPMGLLFTFSLFKELSNSKTNHLYLALPISSLERLTAKWLTATLVYLTAFSLVSLALGTFAMIVGIVLFKADFNLFALFSTAYWKTVATYLFVQPIFMVGALSFTKNRIAKTLLAIGLAILCFVFLNLIMYALFNGGFGVFSEEGLGSNAFTKAGDSFSGVGRWFYGLIFGPLMLVVAYFKMAEKEV